MSKAPTASKKGLIQSQEFTKATAEEQSLVWLAENRAAIKACNEDVMDSGVWSDGLRDW